MKRIVVGILAHVDAGKTTLSEGLLYTSGKIRKLGRVDNRDAYLDTNQMEKERGITIFSKQAVLEYRDLQITLLDTPGHVDFSSEMERTLSVLDYAILVVNGSDGVQAHTKTLWRLLKRYEVPHSQRRYQSWKYRLNCRDLPLPLPHRFQGRQRQAYNQNARRQR